jgi:type II secretory pathway component PulL
MSRRVFVDLKEKELSVYLQRKNGKSGFTPDVSTVPVGAGYSFSLESTGGEAESFLSLPLRLLDFRILELPFSDTKKLRELLPFEIDGLILGGSGSVVFDAVVLGRKNGNHRVLVAYISKETLGTILEKLKAAGLDPAAVTCLELSHVLAEAPADEIADRLISPPPMTAEDRMNTALREMGQPTLNLRRGEFTYTVDAEKTRKSLRTAVVLAALLLAVFLADRTITIFSVKRENAQLRADIRQTYRGLFPGETKISDELYQLKAHLKELGERESSFVGVSPLGTLLDLSGFGRPGLSLSEVSMERGAVVLKGECLSLSDVQKYADALGGGFSDVVISDTKPSEQNRILFTITARVKRA